MAGRIPVIEATVLIATHNRWPILRTHALPSALGQQGVAMEVIVVDDGSTDETPEELALVDDPRLRLIRNQGNRGVAAARNAGIAAARGEWVAFLDDDDLWSPCKVRAQIDSTAGREWGYASAVVVDEGCWPVESLPLPDPASVADALMMGNIVPGGPSNVVVRTDALRRLGGFDETLVHHTEDWDLWIRLARASPPAVCPELLTATMRHPGRSALQGGWEVVEEIERLLGKYGSVGRAQKRAAAEWLALSHHRGGNRLRASALYVRAAVTCRSPGNLPRSVGALFGERGMSVASRLLDLLGRGSTPDAGEVAPDPSWLERYRASMCPENS